MQFSPGRLAFALKLEVGRFMLAVVVLQSLFHPRIGMIEVARVCPRGHHSVSDCIQRAAVQPR